MTGSLRRAAIALLTAASLAIAPSYARAQDASAPSGPQPQRQFRLRPGTIRPCPEAACGARAWP